MSSQFDSPTADLRMICQHCGCAFMTRYPDAKYCTPQHRDAAAKKRQRAKGALKLQGLDPEAVLRPQAQATVIRHPQAREAARRDLEARLATPYAKFCAEFGAKHGRPPLDEEVPLDILATANPNTSQGERKETMEEALRALGFTSDMVKSNG